MEKNGGGADNRGVSGGRTTVYKRVNSALSVAGTLLLPLPGDHRQVLDSSNCGTSTVGFIANQLKPISFCTFLGLF